jgi:LCP family protein required for cell wall assembly
VVVIGLFAMFSGLAIAAATWTTKHVEDTVERVPHVFPTGDRPAQAVAGLTFLLVGRDPASQSDTDSLADSIMLIHVDGSRKDAQVLYLPVSAQVEPGGPTLDEVFGEGGPAQLIGDVEGFTGIRIDHYAELDFAGFRTVTDAVGGVEIDVPEPYSNDRYDFPTGRQHLDGAAALAYVRDAERASEAGAAERQQAMIAALFERVSDQGLLSDVGRLTGTLDSMADALRVDDTLSDVDFVQLVWSLRGVSEPDFLTAPLDGTTVQNGRAVVTFDPARAPLLWSYVRDDVLDEHLGEFR